MVDASRTRVSFSSAKFICRSICRRSIVSRSFFALMLSAINTDAGVWPRRQSYASSHMHVLGTAHEKSINRSKPSGDFDHGHAAHRLSCKECRPSLVSETACGVREVPYRAIFSSRCFTCSSHGSLDDSDRPTGGVSCLRAALLACPLAGRGKSCNSSASASSSYTSSSTSCGVAWRGERQQSAVVRAV
jgi:hypothetical protein